MGFRMRRSLKIVPGVRLNVSNKSVGVSAGVKGARVSTNTRTGTTGSVGIPGSGISYSQKLSGGGKRPSSVIENSLNGPATDYDPHEGYARVSVSGNILRWPWVCSCCACALPEPPLGSKPVGNSTIYEIRIEAANFSPALCAICERHVSLAGDAIDLRLPDFVPTSAGTVAGCAMSTIVWFLTLIIVVAITQSGTAGFIISFIAGVACFVGGMNLDQKQNEAGKIAASESKNKFAMKYEQAKQAMQPQCTLCEHLSVDVESAGTVRHFWFSNEKVAYAFGKLNEDKVVH